MVAVKSLMSEKKIVSFLRSVAIATSRLAAEDALVDLRRQVFGDLHRDGGEEVVGLRQLAVDPRDQRGLPPLQDDEGDAGRGSDREIEQQVFEREHVAGDRLADGDLLDAAHVADLPVLLRAVGMDVVAIDAALAHHDRCRDGHPPVPHALHLFDGLQLRIGAESGERVGPEGVEFVPLVADEGIIGNELVADPVVRALVSRPISIEKVAEIGTAPGTS